MKYRLTGEEMELLAMHRAKLDAKSKKSKSKKSKTKSPARDSRSTNRAKKRARKITKKR